jgi:hypothetical protein
MDSISDQQQCLDYLIPCGEVLTTGEEDASGRYSKHRIATHNDRLDELLRGLQQYVE